MNLDHAIPIIGRDSERQALWRVVDAHRSGHGAIVSIDGAAGIGKTRLLADLAEKTEAAGCDVLWVQASEVDRIRPFGCLLDVLDCRLGHPDPLRRRVAEGLVASAEATIDPFRFDHDGAWRFPAQEAIVDVFLDRLDQGPLLVAVDDAHWADAGTLGVLKAVARRTTSGPLVVAWSRRTGYPAEPLDEVMGRWSSVLTSVTLGPLDAREARAMARALSADPSHDSDEMRARVELAGGVPFLLSVVARAPGAAGVGPASAILGWFRTLPSSTADLLAVASILGLAFDVAVLGSMVERPAADLVPGLEPAVRAGLLRPIGQGRYAFAHDLVRSVVLEDLPSSMRAALHREAAEVLRRGGADVGVIAQHLSMGARPGDEAVAREIRSACVQIVRHDASSAAELLSRAMSLCTPGSPTWALAAADRVVALQWAGRAGMALELAEDALAVSMPSPDRVALRLGRATSRAILNDLPNAALEYRELVADQEISGTLRASILSELMTLDSWGLDRSGARSRGAEALAFARSVGSVKAEMQTLCALATISLFDGDVSEAVRLSREAVRVGRDDNALIPAREIYLGLSLAASDEHDEAALWLASGQERADAVSDLWLVSRYQLARITNALFDGSWAEAVADAEAIISLNADTGMASGMPQAPAIAGIIALRRGSPDAEIERYRALAGASATGGAEPGGLLFFGWFEGLRAEREGRAGEAAATLDFVGDSASMAPLMQLWLAADLVRTLLAVGNLDKARQVAHRTTVTARRAGARSALGTAALCDALIAEHELAADAVQLAGAAVDTLRRANARASLLQALSVLQRLSRGAVTGEHERLAEQLGVNAPTGAQSGDGSGVRRRAKPMSTDLLERLTKTETDIARSVSDGLSNQDIAKRLGVSKRTVEYHLSNIYAKLAVTTRTAIATVVLGSGLRRARD